MIYELRDQVKNLKAKFEEKKEDFDNMFEKYHVSDS